MAVGLKTPHKLVPVTGIRMAACSAGIYKFDRLDLALIAIGPKANCAVVFTKNAFSAAPIQIARRHINAEQPRFCLVNAGNANAGTGKRGYEDAMEICRILAETANCPVEAILPFSTGVIGEFLPVQKLQRKLPELHANLANDNWLACARAMMTTDTVPKGCSRTVDLGGVPITVTGIAKGSGMIKPDMATMLAFIATDAVVDKPILDELLDDIVNRSFNRICVDGDTSTNDACLLIATGEAGNAVISDLNGQVAGELKQAITDVCLELAQAIVRDGEGATKFITVSVNSGNTSEECLQVAYAIATSPLVKTAFFASDPNWGRILAAVGRAGLTDLDISKISIYLDDICVVENGIKSESYTEAAGQSVMNNDEILLQVDLGRGSVSETVWSCDFSHEYVKINAEYRT